MNTKREQKKNQQTKAQTGRKPKNQKQPHEQDLGDHPKTGQV